MQYLNLDRRFVQRAKYDHEELLRADMLGRNLSWEEVLTNRFAIVVAPANYGKTTELRLLAGREREAGKHALFVELRKLLTRDSIEDALEKNEVAAFNAWQQVSSEPITLLIDSLDEASPTQREDLHHALKKVIKSFRWPNGTARWVISTRPAVLTHEVMTQLSDILEVPIAVTTTDEDGVGGVSEDGDEKATTSISSTQDTLVVFTMAPLTSKQAITYLQSKPGAGALDAPTLLEVARTRGLPGFTLSPGGLDVIAHLDLAKRPPESLTETFRRVVQAVVRQLGGDPRLSNAGTQAIQVDVVRKIAAASIVCQLQNVEIPSEQLDLDEIVLSARLIGGSLLHESALSALLSSQFFIDSGHHQVKPYPEELLPFLAAEHFAKQVQSPEDANRIIEAFSWRAPTGEQGANRRLMSMLGWLATLSTYCRVELLKRDPQVVAFFGDLRNPEIPKADAHKAIEKSIEALAIQGDRLGRTYFRLTPENYWQVGTDGNLALLSELFDKYGSSLRARSALLDVATHSQSDVLRQQVLKTYQGHYTPILHQSMDIHYLLALGVEDDFRGLASALMEPLDHNEGVAAALLGRLAWTHLSCRQIVTLVERQFKSSRGGYHMAYTVSVPVCNAASDFQAYQLARSLVIQLVRIGRRDGNKGRGFADVSEQKVSLVIEVLAELVARPAVALKSRVTLLCLLLRRFLRSAYYGSSNLSPLRNAFQQNHSLRLAVIRKILTLTEPTEHALSPAFFGHGRIITPTLADTTDLSSETLRTTILAEEARAEAANAPRPSARQSRQDRVKIDETSLITLKQEIEQIRDGSARNAIAFLARWLLQTNSHTRYGEVNINALEEAGEIELATAYKTGLSRLWREEQPTFKEGEPRSLFHITAAGLQGLHHELGDGTDLPVLSACEVTQAIQYAGFEINGSPKWFWTMVEAHQGVAIAEFQRIIGNAGMGAVSFEHAEALLAAIDEAPERVQTELAPAAWTFLVNQAAVGRYATESILRLIKKVPGAIAQDKFEAQVWTRLQASFVPVDPPSTDGDGNTRIMGEMQELAAVWGAYWLTCYPEAFNSYVGKWLADDKTHAEAFVFELAAYLGQDRGSKLTSLAKASDDGVDALAALYNWTLDVVRRENDPPRPDGEVYSHGSRDSAQDLRDALIPAIAAAESTRAYEALDSIRKEADGNQAQYLSSVMFDMQEARFVHGPVAQVDFDQFDRDLKPPVTDTVSLALAVQKDLLAVKYSIEQGDFSLRRFFSEVKFSRIVTDKEGLALEADFQALLGSEMNHLAGSRYTVTLESETAEATRRDVLCRKGSDYASIELKMSLRWSYNQYVEALEDQLVGQYMRNHNATTGFLVIVLQTERAWEHPTTHELIPFSEVLELLQAHARKLEGQDRRRFIRVIGIDATPPKSFRDI